MNYGNILIRSNAYFHAQEPWKITDKTKFNEVISATCHSLYAIGLLLYPVMPLKMESLLKSLGVSIPKGDVVADLNDNPWNKTFMLSKIPALFEKYEMHKPEEQPASQPPAAPGQEAYAPITIDDVAKVALVVGTIEQCEEIPGSDKLLKLHV